MFDGNPMRIWLERVKKSIFPLSIEKHDIRKALAEWHYTGETYDLEYPCEDCELCGHRDIRYQFTIRNRNTSSELLIGSECITRFDIRAVDDSGNILDQKDTKKAVSRERRKLITDAKEKRMIEALIQLGKKEEEFDISSFIDYFRDRGAFTPDQLSLLLWRMKKNEIEHYPPDFKLTIRRIREKSQLLNMPDWKIQELWLCMTPSQRKFWENN